MAEPPVWLDKPGGPSWRSYWATLQLYIEAANPSVEQQFYLLAKSIPASYLDSFRASYDSLELVPKDPAKLAAHVSSLQPTEKLQAQAKAAWYRLKHTGELSLPQYAVLFRQTYQEVNAQHRDPLHPGAAPYLSEQQLIDHWKNTAHGQIPSFKAVGTDTSAPVPWTSVNELIHATIQQTPRQRQDDKPEKASGTKHLSKKQRRELHQQSQQQATQPKLNQQTLQQQQQQQPTQQQQQLVADGLTAMLAYMGQTFNPPAGTFTHGSQRGGGGGYQGGRGNTWHRPGGPPYYGTYQGPPGRGRGREDRGTVGRGHPGGRFNGPQGRGGHRGGRNRY
jgi:hypothetical protein